jgi:hypothetical protein
MNEDPLIAYMKMVTSAAPVRPKWSFNCVESFVMANGQPFQYKSLPRHISRGTLRHCFENAYDLALRSGLVYVEGFAAGIIPVLHAWCLDSGGKVVDPTWHALLNPVYYGVPFKRGFVLDTVLRRKMYGIIDDWENGFPLLAGKYMPEEFLECVTSPS